MKPDSHLWDLISLSLSGHASPEQQRQLDAWLNGDSRRRQEFAELQRRWAAAGSSRVTLDPNAMWPMLHQRIAEHVDHVQHAPIPSRQPNEPIATTRAKRPIRIAMGAGLGLALLVAFFTAILSRSRPDATASHVYQTAPGQQIRVPLSDGSTMTLAPATTARVIDGHVELSGEALFTIQSHPNHPFVVQTSNMVAHVLGTRFVVRQYPGESMSRIMVDDGRVGFRPRQGSSATSAATVLAAKMLGQVTDSTVHVTSDVDVGTYVGWTQGRLVFDGTPLRDVVAEVSRMYGVDVRIADTALARQSMTMRISVATHSLTRVLDLICLTNDAHYTKDVTAYVLSPGRLPGRAPQVQRIPQLEMQYGR